MSFNHKMLSWGSLLAVALASCTGSNEAEVGSLNVSVTTTGSNPDADGYIITVGQRSAEPIPADGDITVSELLPGDYPVRISGLAANCFVVGTNPLTGKVTAGGRATAAFEVSCPGAGAQVKVTTAATGGDFDNNGYLLKIGERSQRVPAEGVTNLTVDQEGSLPVQVTDVATNCTPDPTNPTTVTTAFGTTTSLALKFACTATTGAVKVSVTTSGVDQQATGFRVYVNNVTKPLDASKTATFAGVAPGNASVYLDEYSLSANCHVSGDNPRVVAVTIGVTAEVTIPVICVAQAHIIASVSTFGQDLDTDGYTIHLAGYDYYSNGPFYDFAVASSGTTQGPAIQPTTYQVTVDGIAPNCRVTSIIPNPLTMSFADITLAISVQCDRAHQLAFVSGLRSASEIGVGTETGDFTMLTSNAVADSNPAWSPDGTRLAFTSARDGNNEIYVMNADGSNVVRLTNDAAADYQPTWSTDGARIAFVSERDGNAEIYVMAANGSNVVRLTTNTSTDAEPAWSPVDDHILFVSNRSALATGIYVMKADGTGVLKLTGSGLPDAGPAWSASGGQIAFVRPGFSGKNSLQLMNSDGSVVTDQAIATALSASLSWAPDARVALTQPSGCSPNGSCTTFAVGIRRADGTVAQLPWPASSEPAWRP